MGHLTYLKRTKDGPKRGITQRWMLNTMGIVLIVLLVSVASLSAAFRSSVYNSIQQTIMGRSDELLNVFSSSSGYETQEEFSAVSRTYIENFPDKNQMEIMSISAEGDILITSTGFAQDAGWKMPDYQVALADDDGYGYWSGKAQNDERIMAITRIVRNSSGDIMGAIRYVVSMERAEKQIFSTNLTLVAIAVVIIIFIMLSGTYFVNSIVRPINRLNSTAKKIADGNFEVRINKEKDDEIGMLTDTINDMAGELGANENMKNEFISSISHELRTPLTAIKGWAETIHGGDTDKETFDKGMGVIIRESERLSGLVEELLDFSRIETGNMKLQKQRLEIINELDEAVFMFTDRANTEGKTLDYGFTATLPPVIGDVNRLRQVFINVIDNALKYTPTGGTIKVSAFERKGFVNVVISDNGCGIPASHLPNVKKKFYKANQHVRGSGIGLAVADEIITLHGGYLKIDSTEKIGTIVTISIPTAAKLENDKRMMTN